ncbi:MAG: DNA cytosine methyltransferase [Bacilli bacterium]|jgi:DNA (cytosine-5)-methyltransferase 1
MTGPDRVCELFCGAGGMGLGFAQHFHVTDAIDIMPEAVKTYGANHPETDARQRDVRDLSGCRGDFDGITGVIGGPPCQAWSRRNIRQDPDDPRALLLDEYLRVVEEVSPAWFVLENVTTVPRAAKEAITRTAKVLGYTVRSSCLNAADYGAAQTRRRWIVVGARDRTIRDFRTVRPRTVREAFAGVRENWGVMRSSSATLDRLATATPDEWAPMNGEYRNMIRLQWDKPAPTVCNPKKVYMVHPGECRNISLAEAAALQGFPPDYRWHGSERVIAQMIANAMPAEMAAAVAGAIA